MSIIFSSCLDNNLKFKSVSLPPIILFNDGPYIVMGIHSVSHGLQCLGRYGYCDEFPPEQFYRDVRIHPIHKGTTGIQEMDLLGRKVTMQKGKAFTCLLEEINKTILAATEDSELMPLAKELIGAVENLKKVTAHLMGIAAKGSPDLFLADATLYLEAFSIIGIAWQWLKQGLAVREAIKKGFKSNEQNFYEDKLYTMRFFFGNHSFLPLYRDFPDVNF